MGQMTQAFRHAGSSLGPNLEGERRFAAPVREQAGACLSAHPFPGKAQSMVREVDIGGRSEPGKAILSPDDFVVGPHHICTPLSRRALLTTDTELKLMAAAAMIGLKRSPKTG